MKPFNTKKLILIFIMFLGIGAYAQFPLPGDDADTRDVPAPISSLLVVGLIAGAALGYKKLK